MFAARTRTPQTVLRFARTNGARIAPTATLALLLTASLVGLVGSAQAQDPGDFTVVSDDYRAGESATYTITYYAASSIAGNSEFIVTFPGDSDNTEFVLDPDDGNAVSHEYSRLTHEWYIFHDDPPFGGVETWNVQFNITRNVASGEEITFELEVAQNPADVAVYDVDAELRRADTGVPSFTSSDEVEITFATPDEGDVAIDMDNKVSSDAFEGDLVLIPDSNTGILDVTLPFAITLSDENGDGDVDEDDLPAGWSIQEERVGGILSDTPYTLRYTGAALEGGELSRIPFGALKIPPYVADYTFDFVERNANQVQIRAASTDFSLVPNDFNVGYSVTSSGQKTAGTEHVLRLDIGPSNTLAGDSNSGDDVLRVTFPSGFDLSGVSNSDVDLEGKSSGGDDILVAEGGTAISAEEGTITFTLGDGETIPAGDVALLIVRDVVTPKFIGETEAFHIQSWDQQGRALDENNELTFNVVAGGTLSDVVLTGGTVGGPSNVAHPGQGAIFGFAAKVGTANPASVRIYFPSDFVLPASGLTATVGGATAQATVDAELHAVTVSLSGTTLASGDPFSGKLRGFDYPVGVGGRSFALRTINAGSGETDTGSGSIMLSSIPLTGMTADRDENGLGKAGTVVLKFPTHELLTDGSRIQVDFSDGYGLSSLDLNRGITLNGAAVDGKDATITGRSLLILVNANTDIPSGTATLSLSSVTNPPLRPSAEAGGTVTLSILAGAAPVATGSVGLDALVLPPDAPAHLYLTTQLIKDANKLIQVTAQQTDDGVLVSWVLPSDYPRANGEVIPPVGVQVWSSNSPYTLLATYDSGDSEFASKEHMDTDGTGETTYLVTMYYQDDLGKYTGNDAPSTEEFDGASVTAQPAAIWPWVLIGLGALVAVALVAVLVARARKN